MEAGQQYPTSKPYGAAARASSAYKASTFEGLSDRELMTEAARVILQKLHLGRDSYRVKRFDEMTNHHSKVFSILALLLGSLAETKEAMDAPTRATANQISAFYQSFNDRLVFILNARSVEGEFAALIEEMTQFYRLWQPSAPAESVSAPAAPHAAGGNVII